MIQHIKNASSFGRQLKRQYFSFVCFRLLMPQRHNYLYLYEEFLPLNMLLISRNISCTRNKVVRSRLVLGDRKRLFTLLNRTKANVLSISCVYKRQQAGCRPVLNRYFASRRGPLVTAHICTDKYDFRNFRIARYVYQPPYRGRFAKSILLSSNHWLIINSATREDNNNDARISSFLENFRLPQCIKKPPPAKPLVFDRGDDTTRHLNWRADRSFRQTQDSCALLAWADGTDGTSNPLSKQQ